MPVDRRGTRRVITTAPELARELCIDPKRLREYLREIDPTHLLGTRWEIDERLAEAARGHFAGKS
jgi:hypothetical protein